MTRRRVLTLGVAVAVCAVLPGMGSAEEAANDRQRRYVIGVAGMT